MNIEVNYENAAENDFVTDKKKKWFWQRPFFRQLFLIITPSANMFGSGLALGITTVLMPQLREKNKLRLTEEMESWLYSVHGIAALPSLLTLPILTERHGRRLIYSVFCMINAISWIIVYFANSFSAYLCAELLQGLSMGAHSVVGVLYISEGSDPKYRGINLVFKSAAFYWGIWIANTIGTFSDSKNICFLGFVVCLFASIGMILLPESPVWLAGKGRYDDCKRSFLWFRGKSENTLKDFKELITHYSFDYNNTKQAHHKGFQRIIRFSKQIRLREFYLPFVLSMVCFAMSQLCGKIAMSVYALIIVKELTRDIALAYRIMLIIDVISIGGMYIGCYLVFKLKRRVMFCCSSFAGAICLFLMSILLFLSENNIITINSKLMLILLMLYSFAISFGPMTLSTSLFAELVPHKYKVFTTGSASIALFGLHTTLLKSNHSLMTAIGLKGVFLFYAFMSSLVSLFLYCFMPETKDKTLVEIEQYFARKTNASEQIESSIKERDGQSD